MSSSTTKRMFLGLLVSSLVFLACQDVDARRRSKKDLIPDPKKYAALVMHSDTGVILHEKNADKKRHPASLVKMMTLYLTFDALKSRKLSLNQYLTVSRRAARQPSLNIGLRRGERIKVKDAIYALTVRSANDVSVVIAEALSGSESRFARNMTAQARRLGMLNTVFKNSSGLYHKEQLTTARDMAKLLVALQRDFPKYSRYMSRTRFMRKGRQYKTHNKMLTIYRGTTGGKTGYINASGFNLVTSARRRNHNLVAVVMGGKTSRSRDRIMVSLLDRGFNSLGRISTTKLRKFASVPTPILKPWHEPMTIASAGKSGERKLWTIEMGGFGREYEVVSAVTNAMDLAPEQLAFSQINFINRRINGEQSHWARFVKLTEQQAKKACDVLLSSHTLCKIVDE